MNYGSWVEFNKLISKLEDKEVDAQAIQITRRKLSDAEDYDFNVRASLRCKDYTILTATIGHSIGD